MSRILLAGLCVVAVCAAPLLAGASLPKSLPKDLIGGYVPSGPYQETCSNAHMDHGLLVAYCQRDNGVEYYSSLNTSKCKAGDEIVNRHGNLMCWKPDASPSPSPSAIPKVTPSPS